MILFVIIVFAVLLGVAAIYTQVAVAAIERAHPPAGRMIVVDGVRLHVLERGEDRSDASTLVLLHGASGNLEDMRMALGALNGRRMIMIDRPGLGWSDGPGGSNEQRLSRQVALIHDALETLAIKRVTLVGHSLGGALAANYALTYPETIAGLVLVSPVTHPWPGGIALYYNIFAMPLLGELFAYTIAYPLSQVLVRPALRAVFSPQPVPPDYRERTAVDLAFRPQVFLDNARDVAALNYFVAEQASRYADIKVPTVVVTGDSDRVVSPDIHSRTIAAKAPMSRLVVEQNVGHMPHHHAPERIAAAINQVERDSLTRAVAAE